MLLYAVPWPPQGIYAKKDLNRPRDMEGVKFRAYNSATARIAELMGAVPVQIEEAELSQALATGVADSFISSGATGYDRKVWEQLDHWYDVKAWLPRNIGLRQQGRLRGPGRGQRRRVLEAAETRGGARRAKAEELNDWYKEQLTANGMTVQPPGDQLRADLEAIGETMTEEWLEEAGEHRPGRSSTPTSDACERAEGTARAAGPTLLAEGRAMRAGSTGSTSPAARWRRCSWSRSP